METDMEELRKELKHIRKELHDIKETMPDKEMFLTVEESRLLYESHQNEKKGKLTFSRELRRELGSGFLDRE